MARGIWIVFMLLGIGLEVLAAVLGWSHLAGGLEGLISEVPLALLAHAAGCFFFAVGAAKFFACRSVLLGFVIASVMPVVGMLTVLGLNRVMAGEFAGEVEEEEFDIGNPLLGLPQAGGMEVVEKPIARLMRELDSAAVGRMILGLSKRGSAERGHQVLRRYQQDSDVELQFYAQNAQRGATEPLERRLKALRGRLEEDADEPAVHAGLAEVLVELAGRRTTSGSDANAYLRRAIEHLKNVPERTGRAVLELRAYLLLREPAGARTALERLPEQDLRWPQFEAEVLYAERDWQKLAECAGGIESSDIRVRTACKFWKESA